MWYCCKWSWSQIRITCLAIILNCVNAIDDMFKQNLEIKHMCFSILEYLICKKDTIQTSSTSHVTDSSTLTTRATQATTRRVMNKREIRSIRYYAPEPHLQRIHYLLCVSLGASIIAAILISIIFVARRKRGAS